MAPAWRSLDDARASRAEAPHPVSLERFQIALTRLVVDRLFRERLVGGGDWTELDDLTDLERRRLAAVASSAGLRITVLVHRGWRLGKLLSLLPRTCSLLGPDRLAAELDRFWSDHLPRSLYFYDEALAFADHLERHRQGPDVRYLDEVIAYERARLELMRPGTDTGETRMVAFRHDPVRLFEAIAPDAIGEGPPVRPTLLIGERLPDGHPRWRAIDAGPAQH
jgi:hypothetical protein